MDSEKNTRAWLTTEVKFAIAVITFVIGVITPYFAIQKDIALIQKDISIINVNHETHIQDIVTDIKEIRVEQKEQNGRIEQNQQAIIKLLR